MGSAVSEYDQAAIVKSQQDRNDLGVYLIQFQAERGLTGIEMSKMLLDQAADILKYELRAERERGKS